MWTLDELVDRVGQALATQYPGPPNNRIRDLPDRRAVRWDTTLGLVDRPAAMRGRTALYDGHHLLQLVALKRRQAAGRTLAQIQAELTGATDTELAAVAAVPEDLLREDTTGESDTEPARARFWADPPAAPESALVRPSPPLAPEREPDVVPLAAVALAGGAVLLLPGTPAPGDYAELAAAARPLL